MELTSMKKLSLLFIGLIVSFGLIACSDGNNNNNNEDNNANNAVNTNDEEQNTNEDAADTDNNASENAAENENADNAGNNEDNADENADTNKDAANDSDIPADLEDFEEAEVLSKHIELDKVSSKVETDNPNKRVILFEDDGEKVYKSIFIKNENRLKIIDIKDGDEEGQIYNEKID